MELGIDFPTMVKTRTLVGICTQLTREVMGLEWPIDAAKSIQG